MVRKPKLLGRMKATDTDLKYLATHYVKLASTAVYHNTLKDMTTACGLQLICGPKHLKARGEPRCQRCIKAVTLILHLTDVEPQPQSLAA